MRSRAYSYIATFLVVAACLAAYCFYPRHLVSQSAGGFYAKVLPDCLIATQNGSTIRIENRCESRVAFTEFLFHSVYEDAATPRNGLLIRGTAPISDAQSANQTSFLAPPYDVLLTTNDEKIAFKAVSKDFSPLKGPEYKFYPGATLGHLRDCLDKIQATDECRSFSLSPKAYMEFDTPSKPYRGYNTSGLIFRGKGYLENGIFTKAGDKVEVEAGVSGGVIFKGPFT